MLRCETKAFPLDQRTIPSHQLYCKFGVSFRGLEPVHQNAMEWNARGRECNRCLEPVHHMLQMRCPHERVHSIHACIHCVCLLTCLLCGGLGGGLSVSTTRQVPADILLATRRIVCFCEQREYVKANDLYVQMAIGNAPWPIGVTMVGIHERGGRDRIKSNKVAHVMNDEMMRKYVHMTST